MSERALLTVRDLTAGYRPDAMIIENISFSATAGEFVSVVAPNGTGKSTLLKCITGTLKPASGEIHLAGRPRRDYGARELARRIAVVADEECTFAFAAEQLVLMGRFAHIRRFAQPTARDYELVQAAMESVGIWHKRSSRLHQLSQGERQKVMIARALAQEPQLLLLDEPTSHLDIANQYAVLELVRQLASERKIAVIAVLHDINLALRFSSRLILLQQGRVLVDAPPMQALTPANLEALYGMKFVLMRQGDICCVQPA